MASETIMPYIDRHSVVAFSKKSDQISHDLLVGSFMCVFIHSFLPGAGKLEVNDIDPVFEWPSV